MRKIYNKLEDMVRKYVRMPLAAAGLAGIISCGNSYAQEFKVNSGIGGYSTHPRIAMNKDSFVITYRSERGNLSHIYGQRFDNNGNKIEDEFRIGYGVHSSIAMTDDGDFIIIGGYDSIHVQRFDRDGNRLGEELRIAGDPAYAHTSPVIVMNNEGRFVICWKQFIFDDDPRNAFYAQIFNEDGNTIGDNFFVSEYIGGLENPADIAMRDDGDFVITWDSRPDLSIWSNNIFAQRYDRDGNKLGERVIVSLNGGYPNVAMDGNGHFILAWGGRGKYDEDAGVFAQRFDRNGNRIGEEFQVNSYVEGGQGLQSIAMNDNGYFVMTWMSWGQDGDGGGIYAQRFDRNGNRIGEEFQVNSFTEYSQHSPQVAMNNNGDFVATWTSEKRSTADIYAQTFHFNDVFFRRGDANRDKEYDISDPVNTLKYLFNDNIELKCLDAADANDDGNIDVSDPIYSLRYLFLDGQAPLFPYPWTGKDYTQDNLDCREY